MLYKERDWAYIIASDSSEGFIPSIYCAPLNSKLQTVNEKLDAPMLPKKNNTDTKVLLSNNNRGYSSNQDELESNGLSKKSTDSLLNISKPTPFTKLTYGRYIVLFGFQAQQENDIGVSRGHFVTVLNQDDPDWFWVQRSDGEEGFVPSTYLCPAEGQTIGKIYHQQISHVAVVCSTIHYFIFILCEMCILKEDRDECLSCLSTSWYGSIKIER